MGFQVIEEQELAVRGRSHHDCHTAGLLLSQHVGTSSPCPLLPNCTSNLTMGQLKEPNQQPDLMNQIKPHV
jgi:hypothetical protein